MGRKSTDFIPNLENTLAERYLLNGEDYFKIADSLGAGYNAIRKRLIEFGIDKNPTNKKCSQCNKSILVLPSRSKQFSIFFCSKDCHFSFQKENPLKGEKSPCFNSVEVECSYCKAKMIAKPCKIKRSKNICCSKKCSSEFRKGKVFRHILPRTHVKCSHCGSDLFKTDSEIEKSKNKEFFCSQKCHYSKIKGTPLNSHLKKGETKKCSNPSCQNSFYVKKALLNRTKNGNFFCSRKCHGVFKSFFDVGENHHRWKGGYGSIGNKYGDRYYGPDWKSRKKERRSRDKNICQNCGLTKEQNQNKNMAVHHVIPWRLFIYPDRKSANYKLANDINNLICYCPKCHSKIESETTKIIDAMCEDTAKVLYGTQKQCN